VILQVPNYPPFREAIEHTGRKLIPLPMECHADGYRFNLERLEARIDARARIFLLCNPQNPTGRVFTRAELEQVAAFAERHDLIVVSDEIHADLVHPGSRHVPFASLSPRAAARTITLNSATKSFNIPGLRCGVAHFGSRELMERFHRRIPARLTGAPNNIGIDATAAAWTDDGPWLGAVRDHLLAMRDHACASLRRELPQIRFHVPESTYLLWLDCSALDIGGSAARYFLEHARVGLSPGEQFLPGSQHRVRLNFATSKPILDEILERMASAIRLDGR
jgi:cystathionine beta-lyase